MTALRVTLLGLALWGTVHPMTYFILWFNANGFDLAAMAKAWNVNDATRGLVWDLTIAAVTLTVWVLYCAIARKQWKFLIVIPATFCIGVSCGLPLYFYFELSAQADGTRSD